MSSVSLPFGLNQPFGFYGVDNHQFKLGRNVYEAIEDPVDGYRSHLDTVVVRENTGIFFKRAVDTVIVREASDPFFSGYEVVSTKDEHVWLLFGTEQTDEYYPWFVFTYSPRKGQ